MAEDIKTQKERIGGDWAIAHVILLKEIRDKMREWLGPHLVFVHLQMSAEDRRARVLDRHMGETNAADLMDVNINNHQYYKSRLLSAQVVSKNMEAIADEEPNTVVLNVTKDMNKEDVLAEILRRIDELQTSGVSKEFTRLLEGYYKSDNHYCQTFKVSKSLPFTW